MKVSLTSFQLFYRCIVASSHSCPFQMVWSESEEVRSYLTPVFEFCDNTKDNTIVDVLNKMLKSLEKVCYFSYTKVSMINTGYGNLREVIEYCSPEKM